MISSLCVDVMSGIPHQTVESYLETLERLCACEPEHISAYSLIVEPQTPFGRMSDRLPLPDEDAARELFLRGIDFLESQGYHQYEISNFAKTGYASRHNLKYWNAEPFLGFGPAAYSDFEGSRFGNSRDLSGYLQGKAIREMCETPSPKERMNEYVMLRMRTAEGVLADAFFCRFGVAFEGLFGASLAPYIAGGLVKRSARGWSFTPEGMCVSNAILSEILEFDQA